MNTPKKFISFFSSISILLVVFFVVFSFGFSDLKALFPIAFGEKELDKYTITTFQSEEGDVLGESDQQKKENQFRTMEQFIPLGVITPEVKSDAYGLAVTTAHASVILDVDSGTILHYDNGREQKPIASLTKMMTALLMMEEVKDLDEVVTITQEMRNVEGTVVGCPRSGYCISTRLQVDEKIRVRDLMKAMLMNSTNDAATALAIHLDGSVENFAKRMNRRALSLGLTDTHFCTPSGLEIEGEKCYSSAYDIARIVVEALKYEEIWEMMNLPSNTSITSVDGKYTHEILNTNALLGQYDGLVGTKTGFTPDAGYCLLAVNEGSRDQKHRIVSIVLDDPYRWESIQQMASWAFDSYVWE